jgi:hypothetical protein
MATPTGKEAACFSVVLSTTGGGITGGGGGVEFFLLQETKNDAKKMSTDILKRSFIRANISRISTLRINLKKGMKTNSSLFWIG